MTDDNGTRIVRRGHLTLRFDKRTMSLTYAGNMGSSVANINRELSDLGLCDMSDLRCLPSFYEEGSPDYLYSAAVTLADLPAQMKERVSTLLQKISTSVPNSDDVSDIDVSSAGAPVRLPGRRRQEDASAKSPGMAEPPVADGTSPSDGQTLAHIRVLAEVAKAMRDAPTLATADPRFWVVQQRRWREVPEGHGGDMAIRDAGSLTTSTGEEFAHSWLEWAMGRDGFDAEADEVTLGTSVRMRVSEGGDRDDPWDWEVTQLDAQALREDVEEGIVPPGNEVVWLDWEWETVENTLFLTLEECERHIGLNRHHYDHPRSFCMHAWRSPQVASLWEAIKGTDWDAVALAISGGCVAG